MTPFEQQQFKPGHVSTHDLSSAGRASRKLRVRRLELIKQAAIAKGVAK